MNDRDRAAPEALARDAPVAQSIIDLADALRAAEKLAFFDSLGKLIDRAKSAGALREDFRLEDIPLIMCSLGSLQSSTGEYTSWRRQRGIVLDGLRAPGTQPLPDEPVPALERPSRRPLTGTRRRRG